MRVLIRNARVLLPFKAHPGRALRGREMNDWVPLDRAEVLIEGDRILAVEEVPATSHATVDETIDADGRVLMPGLVDCHTHACWAGSRLSEWEMGLAGVPYLELLRRGGGIMSTVRDVRQASQQELSESLQVRLARMVCLGSTTIEVKSGYGLSTADELKMLRAVADAAQHTPATVVATALLGHAIDSGSCSAEQFVRRTIEETLPAVHAEFPDITIDAYCETGAWSLPDCHRLFERAMQLGHPIRIHADQFNNLGIVALNREWSAQGTGFRSIDHLEASDASTLQALAGTSTIGTLLPCAGFHTDRRYADGRSLIDSGGAAAIATNANPGSAPCFNMQFAIALAVRFNRLTVREAIAGATINAAAALGLTDRGVIAPGTRADLVLLRCRDERSLAYEFGDTQVERIIVRADRIA